MEPRFKTLELHLIVAVCRRETGVIVVRLGSSVAPFAAENHRRAQICFNAQVYAQVYHFTPKLRNLPADKSSYFLRVVV